MLTSKLAIIDPVGIKAGMNCYDLGLLNAINKEGIKATSFSNFIDSRFNKVKQYNVFLKEKKGVLKNTGNFVRAHIFALRICKKEKIKNVLLHVFSAAPKDLLSFTLCRFFGCNIIAIVHDVNSLSNEDTNYIRKKMYDMATTLVVHNNTSKMEILPALTPQQQQKLVIIPHGNYVDFVEPVIQEYFSEDIVFDKEHKYLLFFGQIKRVKGLDILLRAIPNLPEEYILIIAGRPHRDNFEYYDNIINELNIKHRVIKIIRFISDDERNYLFNKCDALMLPYRKIFQSGVLLLSMSYGLPVIAADLEANKEVVINGVNGYLFSDGNSKDMADKIQLLFSFKDVSFLKQNTIKTISSNHSWTFIASQYANLINN